MDSASAIMTVREAAHELSLTDETVCGYIRRGELAASGLGTNRHGEPCPPYAILRDDLLRFVAARRIQVRSEGEPAPADTTHAARRRRRAPRRGMRLVEARENS